MTTVQLKPNERIDQLSAQGVQIIQSSEVFAFSLDAVLLADFVRPNQRQKSKSWICVLGMVQSVCFCIISWAGIFMKSSCRNGWLTWLGDQ